MLYVSTRDRTNTYTAHRALFEQCASDGGMFVPFQLPQFSQEDILRQKSNSFGTNVADILNLFFSARLTGWDIDFCCGRYPVDVLSLPHKLLIAEAWHNTESNYQHIEQTIYGRLCGRERPEQISRWAKIAIRIALLFATYACIPEIDCEELDLAVDDCDFIAPIAALYARKMGLPVSVIICGGDDNGSCWDLVHKGELNTVAVRNAEGLEQLIFITLGPEEVKRFAIACQTKRTYHLAEDLLYKLNDRIFVAVVSDTRVVNVIQSFQSSVGYALDRTAAISFAALQDYRARVGENSVTMIFSLQDLCKDIRSSVSKRG